MDLYALELFNISKILTIDVDYVNDFTNSLFFYQSRIDSIFLLCYLCEVGGLKPN